MYMGTSRREEYRGLRYVYGYFTEEKNIDGLDMYMGTSQKRRI